MKKRNWLALSGAMAAFVAFQPAAHAQSAAPSKPAADAGESTEVVITAQKREETVQTAPLAVSAFSAKDRDKLGIKTVQDLTNVVPGVSYSVGLDRFYVRGIGRTSNGGGTDGGTAIYHDNAFTESSYGAAIPNIFYPTIQVLRGPQVTLFGRNAIGGALLIDEKHPDRVQSEEFRASYGSYERWEAATRISGPMPGTDKIRYSLAANYWDQGDGYLKNVNGGKNEGGNGTFGVVGGQLDMDFTDNLNVWMKLENFTFNYSNRNIGINSQPWVDGYAASVLSYYPNSQWAARGNDGAQPTADALNITRLGPAQTNSPGFSTGDRYAFVGDTFTHQTLRKHYNFGTHVNWDLGSTQLKYIVGAQRYFYNLYLDNDNTNILSYTVPVTSASAPLGPNPTCTNVSATPCATISGQTIGGYIEDRAWWTHEVDWSSKNDGPLQWLGGLFYYHETEANPQYADNPGIAGTAYLTPTAAIGIGDGAPNPMGHQYWYNQVVKSTSAAAFGQLDYNLTDTLKVTAGLRYTHDEKAVREELKVLCYGSGSWFGYCLDARRYGAFTPAMDITVVQVSSSGVMAPTTDPGVLGPAHYEASTGLLIRNLADSWNATTGSLALNWTPDENTLLYARYDRGYKAGAFTNALNIVRFPEADKEGVNAYEIGGKFRPLDRLTANMSIFYYDWKNRQTPITVPGSTPLNPGPTAASLYVNLPKSETKGFEFESQWTPFTDAHLRFTYAYLDATVKQAGVFVDNQTLLPANVDGAQLPQSPKNRVNVGGDYTFRPDIGPITVAASYSWREKAYSSIFNTPSRLTPGFDNVNLTGSWTDTSGRFTVFAFVNNAFDKKSYQYVTNNGVAIVNPSYYAGATTSGLGAYQISTSAPGTPTSYSTYNANPLRTWGVELRAKF